MSKPSRERIANIARLIVDEMSRSENVRLLKEREAVRQSVVHALLDEFKQDEERRANVMQRLAAMPDSPPLGSREWESVYRKLLDEEYERTGFDTA
jgi:hypothetical protein